jgi:hypothetical protein
MRINVAAKSFTRFCHPAFKLIDNSKKLTRFVEQASVRPFITLHHNNYGYGDET